MSLTPKLFKHIIYDKISNKIAQIIIPQQHGFCRETTNLLTISMCAGQVLTPHIF